MTARAMITITTTKPMTVSCHMANGKNGFPSFFVSSLYRA
jgi:hypothetical protein